MIPNYFSTAWATSLPALSNHLWQSTLFAMIVGSLTLVMRRAPARTRYCLWFASSVKFLIPFSVLVSFGNHFARPHAHTQLQPIAFIAMGEVSQPFIQPTVSVVSITSSASPLSFVAFLPTILLSIWVCGIVVVVSLWFVRWYRIYATLSIAEPLSAGREVEALKRIVGAQRIRKQIRLFSSKDSVEPGVFGIVRPILIWPENISNRLDNAHLEAILTHEVCHVRRRDNFTAAIHMIVEAIFWFHPLVWWLGARLIAERERACDEEVINLCKQPRVYAESILVVCKFCVEAPLPCISGVTGSDLKKRIVHIMTEHVVCKLSLSRKVLLFIVGSLTIALPAAVGALGDPVRQGQLATPPSNPIRSAPDGSSVAQGVIETVSNADPSFEVATIKPNNTRVPMIQGIHEKGRYFSTNNSSLCDLLQFAYDLNAKQLTGGPDWICKDRYDISAVSNESGVPLSQVRVMLQKLLRDRFNLTYHREKAELPAYVLTTGMSQEKLIPTKLNGPVPVNSLKPASNGWTLTMRNATTADFAGFLQMIVLDKPVVDETSIKGRFDMSITFAPDNSEFNGNPPPMPEHTDDSQTAPSLFESIHEQLGLKIERERTLVDVIVIDHVERPSPN
ncbi:MAG: M56 family metallopeptidase [Acidobacteriaceae bacterium]